MSFQHIDELLSFDECPFHHTQSMSHVRMNINASPQILTCRPLFISTEGVTAYGQPDRITYYFKNEIYIFCRLP